MRAARASALGSNRGLSALGPAVSTGSRNRAVRLRDCWTIASGVPRRPGHRPRSPASGPRSMSQSAVLITSRLCSMIDHRVAQVGQAMDDVEELADVVEVQARSSARRGYRGSCRCRAARARPRA